MRKPEPHEYKPFAQTYIDLVTEGDFLELLKENSTYAIKFFSQIPLNKHDFKYAPDKWSIKEILMHLIDTERIFSYRALVCARGDDKTEIQSYDDDFYAANAFGSKRTISSLIEEFMIVRRGTEILFENITEEQSKFLGNNITHKITARALGYMTIGHVIHHITTIQNKYLQS